MCLRRGKAPQEKRSRTQSDLDTLRVVEVESSELLDNGRQSDGAAPILVVQDGHRDASCDGICTRADAHSNSCPESLTAPSGRAVCLNGGITLQLSLARMPACNTSGRAGWSCARQTSKLSGSLQLSAVVAAAALRAVFPAKTILVTHQSTSHGPSPGETYDWLHIPTACEHSGSGKCVQPT